MTVDYYTDFIQHTVGLHSHCAAPRCPSSFRVPEFWVYGQFTAELCLRPVNRDTSHYRNSSVFPYYLSFEVENDSKCTSHNSTIFGFKITFSRVIGCYAKH